MKSALSNLILATAVAVILIVSELTTVVTSYARRIKRGML